MFFNKIDKIFNFIIIVFLWKFSVYGLLVIVAYSLKFLNVGSDLSITILGLILSVYMIASISYVVYYYFSIIRKEKK